jgi:hypothetical protein
VSPIPICCDATRTEADAAETAHATAARNPSAIVEMRMQSSEH